MAHQLLGVRSFPKTADDGSIKYVKFDAFFEKRWRIQKPEDIFTRPTELLDQMKVPLEERFNLYYTVADCDDTKRGFKSQDLLIFDIDDVDHSRIEEYETPVCETLGVTPSKVVVVSSGGGLHFIVKMAKPITDPKFFEDYRPQFKALCKMIDRALEAKGLRGKPDPSVFEPRRILRMPGTKNVKPGRADSVCTVLRSSLEAANIDLEALTGLKKLAPEDALSERQVRRMRQADGNAAFEQCLFLKHAKENPEAISEPEWYAAASIIGRFKGGREQFHEISSAYPGYSKNETDLKFDQAVENSGPRTCKNINAVWGGCHSCPHFEKISSPVVIYGKDVIPTEATGFYDVIVTKSGEKTIPNYKDLLRAYSRDRNYLAAHWLKSVFEYDGKMYCEKPTLAVKAFAEQMMKPDPTEKIRSEFLAKALVNNVTRQEFFEETTRSKINFQNGVYDLSMQNLIEHSPEIGFTWCLPYEFQPEATCPSWEKFVSDICLGHTESIQNIQEFLGYIVAGGSYKYHKALWFYGTGSNGKSTLITTIKELIGHRNYSVVSIKQIIQDRFASADLFGKIANFCEETSPDDLSDSGPFKNLTGDGEIMAQRKFGEPFTFRNRAKVVMTYNEIPKLRDLSHGMLRRPLVIPLEAKFEEGVNMDVTLGDRLLAERPGIFNWALAGWKRLEAAGRFTPNTKSDEALGVLRHESDSVAQWVQDFVEFVEDEGGHEYTTRQLFDEYSQINPKFSVSFTKFATRINADPRFAVRAARLVVHTSALDSRPHGFKRLFVRTKAALSNKSFGQF